MNTFMYIEKRLIDLSQEQKAELVNASNDEEKALVNALFYTGAKNELESLRDNLMSDVSPVDDELPEISSLITEKCVNRANGKRK